MILEPRNEIELIIWFVEADWMMDLGWNFESATSTSFPDAILSDISGKLYRTEFEFNSSSFIEHEHNPYDCDLIICWKNDFPIVTSFPIWELCSNSFPPNWDAQDADREEIHQYIQKVMTNRVNRRKGKVKVDWRHLRPTLSEVDVANLANLSSEQVREVSVKYNVDVRTVTNWRSYARKEIGVEDV
jgi:hypothetical protein